MSEKVIGRTAGRLLSGKSSFGKKQLALYLADASGPKINCVKVPDAETVEFMESFYKNWLSGVSIESAFNKAQLSMSKKYAAEPSKWGAFVLYQ